MLNTLNFAQFPTIYHSLDTSNGGNLTPSAVAFNQTKRCSAEFH